MIYMLILNEVGSGVQLHPSLLTPPHFKQIKKIILKN
jgi:hypothetical protein